MSSDLSSSTSGDDPADPNHDSAPKTLEDQFASVALNVPENDAPASQESLNGVANGSLTDNNHRTEIESNERQGTAGGAEERIESNLEVEEVRESVERSVVWTRTISELEVEGPSSPSSSGYAGERGSTSASSGGSGIDGMGEDEIQEVRNDGSIDGVSDSPASWVPGKRHLDEDDASIQTPMVVKLMRWPSWPPLSSRKFEAIMLIHRLEGLSLAQSEREKALACEIKWKGQKGAFSSLRRSVKRNLTKAVGVGDGGVVEWNEGFRTVCSFSGYKEGVFSPWKVSFKVLDGMSEESTNRAPVLGTALLNLAEYASAADGKEIQISVPVEGPISTKYCCPSLFLSLSLLELITAREPSETMQKSILCLPLSPCYAEAHSNEKDEFSALKAGLRKVKTFKYYLSPGRGKKASREEEGSDGRCSDRSTDPECNYPTDSPDDEEDADRQSEESKDDLSISHPVSYETLTSAKFTGVSYSKTTNDGQDEFLIYYSNRNFDWGCYSTENTHAPISEQILQPTSDGNIPSWQKRRLSFKPPPKAKGEPLLKKHYGEVGGDDIDYDRRQLSSSSDGHKIGEGFSTDRLISEFGDDKFAVGSWESKEVTCRDRQLKLQTQVFFASIDQRSERAAGESACTALVAVIADWLHSNRDEMPNESEFDRLIRDGSLEWRNLCENEAYIEQFPDKHFDIETIIQAKIRPLSVVPEKSFVGFFQPEGLEERGFDFLHGAMSFDSIWDEISLSASDCPSNGEPLVYIVCWNDHFFVLKVEKDAFYIIDTLGERLYEGCNQAYVLKFDKETKIAQCSNESRGSEEKPKVQPKTCQETSAEGTAVVTSNESENSNREEVVCRGKESCKEYIKNFLAAIPIRGLEADIKKGLRATSTTVHHTLQIEFHYTRSSQLAVESPVAVAVGDVPVKALPVTKETS